MENAIPGLEICFDHWDSVNSHLAIRDTDREPISGEAFEHLSVAEPIGYKATSHYVQTKDVGQGAGRIREKRVKGALWKCREGGIVRGKDGEGRPPLGGVKG